MQIDEAAQRRVPVCSGDKPRHLPAARLQRRPAPVIRAESHDHSGAGEERHLELATYLKR